MKIRVFESAIPQLQKLGWVTETKEEDTTVYTIAAPHKSDDDWPDLLDD